MAQRHYLQLAGGSTVEVTDRVPLEGWQLTEKAEEGAVGSGTMWLADPGMDLDVDGLRTYYVLEDESEATDNTLFGGFVADPELSRGEQGDMHYDPVARNWQIQLTDRNGFWNRRVMTGTDCKRPAETDVQRIAWLFASSEANWIEDDTTYVTSSGGSAMDKVDYRGQYLNQVVDDAAQHTGRNWWVQLQETGTGREDVAWYGKDSRALYSSPLYLSNNPADWLDAELLDGTSLVWPIADQTKLRRDLSRVYSGVYLRYANGQRAIYRTDAATTAVYGRRDHVADYPCLKTKSKATARATRLLDDLGDPDERITTTVELPKGKATMIRAGMRVRFKATHLVGWSDQFYWMRVLACTVTPVAAGDRYRLTLDLQASGAVAAGNGPYTGAAFGSLLSTDDIASAPNEEWQATGDTPPGGWFAEPNVGPVTVSLGSGLANQTVTTDSSMTVRIEARTWFQTVIPAGGGSCALNVVSSIAGVIGTATDSEAPGGFAWSGTLYVDIPSYDAAAGEVFTITLERTSFLTGGFTNTGNNASVPAPSSQGSYLRVGRGTQSWSGGTVTWEGP